MIAAEFDDFAKLYQAAFAEREPARKLLLLQEVRKVLDEWEQRHNDPNKADDPQPMAWTYEHAA
jgi:hypothetical protein